jgi:hypothetical protein
MTQLWLRMTTCEAFCRAIARHDIRAPLDTCAYAHYSGSFDKLRMT